MKKIIFLALLFTQTASADTVFDKLFGKMSNGGYISIGYGHVINPTVTNELMNQTDASDNGEYKFKLSGQRFTGQVGYMIGRVVVGFERSMGTMKYDLEHPSGSNMMKSEFDLILDSAYLMYRGNKWVGSFGFIFSGEAKDTAQESKLSSPGGVSFGVGYKLTNWLQITAQTNSYSFSKISQGSNETELPTADQSKYNGSDVLIGISLAFEILDKKGR